MSSNIRDIFSRYVEKEMPEVGETRRAAFVPEMRSTSEADRTITFVSSTEAPDRYGDVLRVNGWQTKNYMKNPVFLWGHRSGDPPIGKCVELHTETSPKPALVQTVEFADAKTYPFADTIFQLYKGKYLHSVSVGFRPLDRPEMIKDDTGNVTGFEFTNMELLELSAVPLPANPEAVARAIGDGIITSADSAKFFSGAKPREIQRADTAQELRARLGNLILGASLQELHASVIKLQAALVLRRLDEREFEELLTGPPESIIGTMEDLQSALEGA